MRADRLRRLKRIRATSAFLFCAMLLLAAGLVEHATSAAISVGLASIPVGALAFYAISREERDST